MTLTLIGAAILPVIILLLFVYRKDKQEKEPLGMLLKAFFFGVLSCIPAALMESVLQNFAPPSEMVIANGIFMGYGVAGFCEELWKLIMLSLAIWKSKEFDEYFDGIVYATFVSLGFACLENILYVFNAGSLSESITMSVMRALLSVPAHFLFGVMMGYYFSLAKFDPKHRFGNILKALFIPLLLHGTFDALLFIAGGGVLFGAILLIAFIVFDIKMWKWGLKRIRILQQLSQQQNFNREDPFEGFKWEV